MSDFIEAFYYGSIETQKVNPELTTILKKKLNDLTQKEQQLTARLNAKEKELFVDYASACRDFSSACNADSFTTGFRLGAEFTYDTFISKKKHNKPENA